MDPRSGRYIGGYVDPGDRGGRLYLLGKRKLPLPPSPAPQPMGELSRPPLLPVPSTRPVPPSGRSADADCPPFHSTNTRVAKDPRLRKESSTSSTVMDYNRAYGFSPPTESDDAMSTATPSPPRKPMGRRGGLTLHPIQHYPQGYGHGYDRQPPHHGEYGGGYELPYDYRFDIDDTKRTEGGYASGEWNYPWRSYNYPPPANYPPPHTNYPPSDTNYPPQTNYPPPHTNYPPGPSTTGSGYVDPYENSPDNNTSELGTKTGPDGGLNDWYCSICDTQLPSKQLSRDHYEGKKHKKALKSHNEMKKIRQANQAMGLPYRNNNTAHETLPCMLCSAEFNSVEQAQLHYNGKRHIKKLKQKGLLPATDSGKEFHEEHLDLQNDPLIQAEISKSIGSTDEYGLPTEFRSKNCFFCKLCDLDLTTKEQLVLHLTGQRHLSTLKKEKEKELHQLMLKEQMEGDEIAIWSFCECGYKCNVCDVHLNSDAPLQTHLNCKKHKEKAWPWLREQKMLTAAIKSRITTRGRAELQPGEEGDRDGAADNTPV